MRNMKKWSTTIVSALLVTALATGCASQGDSGTASTTDKAGATAKTTTIKLHTWYTEEAGNWNKTIAEFEKKNPDIKVEFVGLSEKNDSQEGLKKLDLLAASGEDLDVIMFSNAAYMSQRASIGLLEPMDEMIKKEGITPKDEYKIDTSVDGKYYALPGKYIEYLVLLNKQMLDDAKLPVPTDWTWAEYMDYAKKLTKGDGPSKQYGTYLHNNWAEYYTLALLNHPTDNTILKKDGSSNLDSPLVKKSLEMRYQMENTDKSSVPFAEIISQKMNYRNVYFGQKAAMLMQGNYMVPEVAGTEKVPATFKTAFALYPKNEASDPAGLTAVNSDFLTIAANSKNKEAAYKFIRWYSTEGIEVQGKFFSPWKKADINKIVDNILAQAKNPEMVDKESLIRVLSSSKGADFTVPKDYYEEARTLYFTEVEKFLLGKQDVDTAIKIAKDNVQKVINANKK
ncbi:sugar ABC transporter substrate-binding protein [Paenibacillus sp. S3N08]|uniref:Sugar ABC transporter substrate-binding protein n=2 Tax=Paenibacillus agricola TaxID=2716264 RepID=A0ABX0J2H7_9BACL|nr:sugar ABC transporter substrate-binding protein [Paenibacillus agricola]